MWRAKKGPVPWWLIPLVVLLVDLVAIAILQPHGPVRDEVVFYPAALAFARAGSVPTLDFLRHYPAPQTPLSLYLAGRVLALAPELWLLRLIDCSLMASALFRFARFAAQNCGGSAQLAVLLLALNPYFHLSATHFYTDALYFWLVVLVVTRDRTRSGGLHALWLGLAPLTRQFGVIFPIGEALQALTERRFRAALAALLALLPVAALALLWHGFLPDTPRADIQRTVHAAYGWFFPYVLSYHVAALGFYLAPLAWCIPRTRRFWVFGAGFAIFYLLAPAHPNFSAELAGSGITTLGYFQRAALLLGPRGASCVLLGFAFLGGGLVGESLAGLGAWRFFVALFVALSAFNFQAWDKYLLDVLPAAIFALLARAPLSRASDTRS